MHLTTGLLNMNWWSLAIADYVLHPFIMVILCLLSVFVVLGNLLVVSAIWHENQLHSVTNYLIASLAAADCLVGAVVMPFSIISEIIIGSWTFGSTWCDLWHSFDVLASTASIMNLCAISLDRYLAITDPISYPRRMTPKRVALLIVSLWTCSSLISFPAIIWWRAVGQGSLQRFTLPTTPISALDMSSVFMNVPTSEESEEIHYKCVFTDDTYYLLFSSFISFYGPLCVMLYAYYRIYKAAVQQTRFLKHGSKQVMIGKNKKSKRSRYISEHSTMGIEKNGLTEGSYDGITSTDNYQGQHLVLRAHRGGGAASIKANNCDNGKNSSGQRKRDIFAGDFKASLDNENGSGKLAAIFLPEDLNQPSLLQANSVQQENNQTLNRRDRVDLTSSKRDKLRVRSQRFETRLSESEREEAIHGGQQNSAIISQGSCLNAGSHNTESRDIQTEDAIVRANHIKQCDQQRGRPLIATMNDRSTSIDVSIIENSKMVESEFYLNQSRKHSTLVLQCESASGAGQTKNQINSNFINTCHGDESNDVSKKSDYGYSVDNYEENSDVDSDSVSTSSGSYGTGSIVSVMIRPKLSQRDLDEKSHTNVSCDTNDSHSSNPKLRRALSHGEARYQASLPRLYIDFSTGNERSLSATANPSTPSNSTPGMHRASCGDQSLSAKRCFDILSNSKSNKTSNIRSWVKLSRPRQRKGETDLGNHTIKPPPSLIPLMMMNSDTSTDSSTAIGSMRRYDADLEEGRNKGNKGTVFEFDVLGMRKNSKSDSNVQNKDISNELSSQPQATPIDAKSVQRDKSLSFREDLERGDVHGKGQILYYDSDKLIQSIVDLTAIHYIDCNNQGTENAEQTATSTIGTRADETGKLNQDTSEHIQLSENSRLTMIPRQNMSVGKKLSKLAKERKAAKTLGIVVGVFILCWLPFFVVNIVVALCGSSCIYKFEISVSIVTWLGWLNSAMNPVIYACWSRDFRRAFRRVLCSWVEFVCPYDGAKLAKKLRLKKSSNYSTQEVHLNRTVSSIKGNTSSATIKSGGSAGDGARGCNHSNAGASRSLLADQ